MQEKFITSNAIVVYALAKVKLYRHNYCKIKIKTNLLIEIVNNQTRRQILFTKGL